MNVLKEFPVGCFTFIMGSLILLSDGFDGMLFLIVLGFSMQGALFFDLLGPGFLRSDYSWHDRLEYLDKQRDQ